MKKFVLVAMMTLPLTSVYANDAKLVSITDSFTATVTRDYRSKDPEKCSKLATAGGGAAGAASGAAMGLIAGPVGAAIGGAVGGVMGLVIGHDASCEIRVIELKKEDGSMTELIDYKEAHYNMANKKVNVKIRSDGTIRMEEVK